MHFYVLEITKFFKPFVRLYWYDVGRFAGVSGIFTFYAQNSSLAEIWFSTIGVYTLKLVYYFNHSFCVRFNRSQGSQVSLILMSEFFK